MTEVIVPFAVLERVKQMNDTVFCRDTCFDYIDSLVRDGDEYGVAVFIEPFATITKYAQSWEAALDWWETVLESQPDDWSYALAGSHLEALWHEGKLPENPKEVWQMRSKAVLYGKIPKPLVVIEVMLGEGL